MLIFCGGQSCFDTWSFMVICCAECTGLGLETDLSPSDRFPCPQIHTTSWYIWIILLRRIIQTFRKRFSISKNMIGFHNSFSFRCPWIFMVWEIWDQRFQRLRTCMHVSVYMCVYVCVCVCRCAWEIDGVRGWREHQKERTDGKINALSLCPELAITY